MRALSQIFGFAAAALAVVALTLVWQHGSDLRHVLWWRPWWWLAAIIQAATTTKPGFRNSDGWIDANPSEYHRTAPLPKSVPKNGSKARATNAAMKPSTARRRTSVGDIMDVMIIAIRASPPKNACRST